jgi:Protein of unknown function (DUF1592)/Protein of unknown function (DUF1588)/Protein of unknown function (DUF1595)
MHRTRFQFVPLIVPALGSLSLIAACSGNVQSKDDSLWSDPSSTAVGTPSGTPSGATPPVSGSSTAGTPVVSGTTTSTSGMTTPPNGTATPPQATQCLGDDTATSKRIVRLSFNQIANTIGTLVDASLTSLLATDNAILDSKHRAFPPLQSPREGNAITDNGWTTIDAMSNDAAQYVFDNFDKVTSCGAAPTDACATAFLSSFAKKAYRRPLTADEQSRLDMLYTSMKGDLGASVNEAVQYGVAAILQAPQFLYRTEFGTDSTVAGALTQYETASALSYFLTDNQPDQQLLDAAAQNQLSTPEQIGAHVDRILQSSSARQNLSDAMISYFNYQGLETIVIQDDAFNSAAMYREGELFLTDSLWQGQLNDLLLSKESYINNRLAEIYGIANFPPAGATVDADGFAKVTLPELRSGILTMPGFLATRSRPTSTSVVGRGLMIKNAVLCTDTPSVPENLTEEIEKVNAAQENQTEREKSLYRTSTGPCNVCHNTFDAYGLALEDFDLVGRHRTADEQGRPIDSSVVLPDQIGGGSAPNMVAVAEKIAETPVFAKCMGRNLINYALADTSAGTAEITSCSTERAYEAFAQQPEKTFSSLIKAVAISASFANRAKGLDVAPVQTQDMSQGAEE